MKNRVSEFVVVASMWIVFFVGLFSYCKRGVVGQKMGFIDGPPAIILLIFFFVAAVLFTYWSFGKKKK